MSLNSKFNQNINIERKLYKMSSIKKSFSFIFFILASKFLIISFKDISLDFKSIAEDILIIFIILVFIILLYKKIFNFKDNIYVDNLKQIIFRYIYLFFVYFFTKCALEMIDLTCINGNNLFFITLWFYFLLTGNLFFLYGKTKSPTFYKNKNNSEIQNYFKSIIIKNKDSENVYSFILKFIPIAIYNIIWLYYMTKINNEFGLISKNIINNPFSQIENLFFEIINYLPSNLIEFLQIVIPFSMMILGSIFMISSFSNKGNISFERTLYRIFGMILGIILFSALSYTYLFIIDRNSFSDLKINFELSSICILKVFISLFYFSITTFTTTGYGDITATNQFSKNLVLIQMLFQVITITISLGMVFNWKNQDEIKVDKYENKFSIGIIKIYRLFSSRLNTLTKNITSKDITNIVLFISVLFFELLFFGILYFLFSDFFFVKGNQKSFSTFFYFSTTTLSTIGFGDIYPTRLFTKLLVSSQMLINMILVLFGINIINSNMKTNEIKATAVVLKKQDSGSGEFILENKKHVNIPKILFPSNTTVGDKVEITIKKIE